MKQWHIVATTEIDKHGDKLTKKALQSLEQDIKSKYALSFKEHDYSNPPIGRIIDSKVKKMKNGEYSLKLRIDFFELKDIGTSKESIKKLVIYENKNDSIKMLFDRSFQQDPLTFNLVKELQKNIGNSCSLSFEVKKALEPESVLTLIGKFTLSTIAGGFLAQLGANACNSLKQIIKTQREKKIKFKIIFNASISHDSYEEVIECMVIYQNPNLSSIEETLKEAFEKSEVKIRMMLKDKKPIKKIVYKVTNDVIEYSYTVGQDGVPIEVNDLEKYENIINNRLY